MAFVKLDCGILNSTIWFDREAREVFLTALLMALPGELETATPQLEVRSLKATGWKVPKGWYGLVPAAGIGIVHRSGVDEEAGLAALERLGKPEQDSRSKEFEGRRLVRVDGGYVVLNFIRYRERDHSAAERSRRYRERKKDKELAKPASRVATVTSRVAARNVTQADADAEADAETSKPSRNGAGDSWVRALGKDWATQYHGTPPYAQIGKHLKALVDSEGFEPVQARWKIYLEANEARYASPARFSQTFGSWDRAGGAPAQEARVSIDEARVAFRAAGIPDAWPVNPDGYWSRDELQRAIDVRVAKLKNQEAAPDDAPPMSEEHVRRIREASQVLGE